MLCMISSSRLRLISMRFSDAPPRGPCSQILTATRERSGCWAEESGVCEPLPGPHSSSSESDEEEEEEEKEEGDVWLVARMTLLNVPWPSTLRARQRRRFLSYRP